MAATCEGCGVAIEDGAFLGMCADCGAGGGKASQAPMVAQAAGGMTGARLALIAGVGVFLLFGVAFFLLASTGAPQSENIVSPVQVEPSESSR